MKRILGAVLLGIVLLSGCGDIGEQNDSSGRLPGADVNPVPRDRIVNGGTLRWPLPEFPSQWNFHHLNGTKGAVVTTSKSMAAELGPDNIRVNCVNPVIGATGLLADFMGMPDTPENRKRFLGTIPLGRFSTPQDIANACLYLASDEAGFITGTCLEVDGGRCV